MRCARLLVFLVMAMASSFSVRAIAADNLIAGTFITTLVGDPNAKLNALAHIEKNWDASFTPMAYETLAMTRDPAARVKLLQILETNTGQKLGPNLGAWMQWWWQQDTAMHAEYPVFKSTFYGLMDPRFRQYFSIDREMRVRLREVVWGGVAQDGIPPLRQPDMVRADEASYLADTDVVYGLVINGDVRAYPKRILAWHEMFVDTIGGQQVAGVYCTLCGTVIIYHTKSNGVNHELGTSGFLYRSNKLMYDKATQSLWSTMRGEPVVGPLVGKNIRLKRDAVVTTTWGEWRQRHPQTTVLSVETGYKRDYGEGVAYRAYFATDKLMFPVPQPDKRLDNKAEVLGLLLGDEQSDPLAISSEFLRKTPVYHDVTANVSFVVLTDRSGANRVYESAGHKFKSWDQSVAAIDESGNVWKVTEAGLEPDNGPILKRLPANRAFWFGWHAAFPTTRLTAKNL